MGVVARQGRNSAGSPTLLNSSSEGRGTPDRMNGCPTSVLPDDYSDMDTFSGIHADADADADIILTEAENEKAREVSTLNSPGLRDADKAQRLAVLQS